jgi:N-acetylmuramoyl-L-alanine amidase
MSGVLDHVPGHGGEDPGCLQLGTPEKDWVLSMALDCETAIKPWGIEQHLTRRTDINTSPHEESQLCMEHGAHLAICHHVNTNDNPEVDGLMCFALASDPWGVQIGDAIMRAAPAGLLRRSPKTTLIHPNDRDWPRVYTSLRLFTCAAVLIEYGFATSPKDREILLDPVSRPALVAAVLCGVARFQQLMHAR